MEHYVTEEECLLAIEHHREGRNEELGRVAMLIASHLAPSWHCPVDCDDLIGDAVLTVLRKASKYVPGKGAAFSYLTSIIKNSFRQSCRDSRHHDKKILRHAQHRHREAGGVGDVRRGVYDEED